MNSPASFVVLVIMIVLSILSILGLVWLTQFSFTAKKCPADKSGKTMAVSNFDNNKLIFCKITVVLMWVNIGLVALGLLTSFLGR